MDYEERITAAELGQGEERSEMTLRPQKLEDYIGQKKATDNLKIFIEAAKLRKEPLDHVLFYGPPGLGKTTLAGIISNEMGVDIRITSGPAIERAGDLAAILTNLNENDVLFIDEIHRLNRSVEEVLYSAMEDFALDIIIGKGPSARSIRLDIAKFTLIGATTRAGSLSAPLRDRFGVSCKFEMYTTEELKKIIGRSAELLGVTADEQSMEEMAKRSRGTPRVANRMLKRVRDFSQVKGNGVIDIDITQKALDALGVDHMGLESLGSGDLANDHRTVQGRTGRDRYDSGFHRGRTGDYRRCVRAVSDPGGVFAQDAEGARCIGTGVQASGHPVR